MVDLNKANKISQTSNAQMISDVQFKRKQTKQEKKLYSAALNPMKTLGKYKEISTSKTALAKVSKDVSWVKMTYNQAAVARIFQ